MNRTIIISLVLIFTLFNSCDDTSNNPKNNYEIKSRSMEWYGKTYSQWAAEWWKWVFKMPVDNHPLFDTAPVSRGQISDDLWFIGGKITMIGDPSVEMIERDVTIPYGTALFFPVSTVSMMIATDDPADSLQILAENSLQNIDEMFCEINGSRVQNLDDFKVSTNENFSYELPENNLLNIEPGYYEDDGFAVGYFLLIDNLSKGFHKIRFYIRQDKKDYQQDVIYNITIE